MKKLILGMVFVLLTALFIGFNYLLLDRENREKELKSLESANASNNANISAQKREISSLIEENKGLEDEIKQLKKENEMLTSEKNAFIAERDKSEIALQGKINDINTLKQHIDIKTLSEPVIKWAEALNLGKYEEAYNLEYAVVSEHNRIVSLDKYTSDMKNTIGRIEITGIKLDKIRGASNGDIFLEVRLNVKLTEDAKKRSFFYKEGANDLYVKVVYSNEKREFIIFSISDM